MKRCTTCNRTYDDSQRLCPDDATPLVSVSALDPQATAMGSPPPQYSSSQPASPQQWSTPATGNKGIKPHTLILAGVGLLLLIGIGVDSYFLTRAGSTDDREKIQGTWQAMSYEDSGRKAPPDVIKNIKWVITKDTITYTQVRDRNTVLTYELDQTKKPKWININAMGEEKDKASLGIYELEGDTLKGVL